MAVTVPLLLSVERTKCPVREDFTAMLAVSSSLILPIKISSDPDAKLLVMFQQTPIHVPV
tara:strand:- start:165 stop:344 length:180 start_codon:yes stop_codon:yes gene_type:complete